MRLSDRKEDQPLLVSYGGGNNSAALLVGLYERGIRPDAILFSDTGGEKPNTLLHMWKWMQPWLMEIAFPPIMILRGRQPQQIVDGTLENECLRLRQLPSKAYGFGSCSDKWKKIPNDQWTREQRFPCQPIRLIGFHAEEPERAERAEQFTDQQKAYPLIEWDWGPDECRDALERVGLPAPGKSACFFCPSSKKAEILLLRKRYPDLLKRALAMEQGAQDGLESIRGLGRRFSWAEFLSEYDRQGRLPLMPSEPEECSDVCFT